MRIEHQHDDNLYFEFKADAGVVTDWQNGKSFFALGVFFYQRIKAQMIVVREAVDLINQPKHSQNKNRMFKPLTKSFSNSLKKLRKL
jgi:hypothetical protein